MQLKDLIYMFEKEIKEQENKIKEKRVNINSNYTLAKLDFRIIENMEDSLKTFKKILEELDKLQERVIQRNRAS